MAPATFLFADMAGFTALTEAHGDADAAELAARFCREVRQSLAEDASVVKTIGDAVMVRCMSPESAVALGVGLTGEDMADHGFPQVRVGIHHGPAVERDGDWYGATVNVAARIAGLAAAGEVLLTDAVAAAGPLPAGVVLEDLGPQNLRHVGEPVRILRANAPGQGRRMFVDPVCRMTVSSRRAAGHLSHEGRTFWFCSLECAGKFAARPERFLSGD